MDSSKSRNVSGSFSQQTKRSALSREEDQLIRACISGNRAAAKDSLKAGARIDCQDSAGQTPLIKAARHNRVALVIFLLNNNADINLADDQGWTPLFWASRMGSSGCMRELIKPTNHDIQGCEINARSKYDTRVEDITCSTVAPILHRALEEAPREDLDDAEEDKRMEAWGDRSKKRDAKKRGGITSYRDVVFPPPAELFTPGWNEDLHSVFKNGKFLPGGPPDARGRRGGGASKPKDGESGRRKSKLHQDEKAKIRKVKKAVLELRLRPQTARPSRFDSSAAGAKEGGAKARPKTARERSPEVRAGQLEELTLVMKDAKLAVDDFIEDPGSFPCFPCHLAPSFPRSKANGDRRHLEKQCDDEIRKQLITSNVRGTRTASVHSLLYKYESHPSRPSGQLTGNRIKPWVFETK